MSVFEFILALVSIVLGCVTLWILIFYRRGEGRKPKRHEPEGDYNLSQLASIAESLQDRIDTLESILDAEIPDWREQNEQQVKSTTN